MKKANRVIALVIAFFMIVAILYSYYFVIRNTYHNCSGEDCPICIRIEEAVHFISNMRYLPTLSVFMAVLCVFTQSNRSKNKITCIKDTLVSLKVELLN